MRALPLYALAAATAACAGRLGSGDGARVEIFDASGATFRLQYWPEDARSARQVREAIASGAPRALRWGALPTPVTVTIYPSHAALEEATHREGFSWLRAWARYASIDLQSPRTWSFFGASEREVNELVTHELTHCALYQATSDEWSWAYRGVPLWFREGMASVAAGQGHRRAGLDDLRRFYVDPPAGAGDGAPGARGAGGAAPGAPDPLANPEPLYRGESDVVYGAAHWAFRFLLDRYGEGRVRGIARSMRGGRTFSEAFRAQIGLPVEDFEQDFRNYVIWRGWR